MKFQPDGIPHNIGGIFVRIVPGRKGPGDMRLEICRNWGHQSWVPVKMALVAYMTEFFFLNETLLYPPEGGFKGGEKFMDFLDQAAYEGYEVATAELEREKAARG